MRAEDALRMQADLRTQLLSIHTQQYVGIVLAEDHEWDIEERLRDRIGTMWCEAERDVLEHADTYMVASGMADLVLLNAQTMPLQHTVITDVTPPSRSGFMVFEDGLGLVGADGHASFFCACSWHVVDHNDMAGAFARLGKHVNLTDDDRLDGGILIQFYRSFRDVNRDWFLMSLVNDYTAEEQRVLRMIGEPHMSRTCALPCGINLDTWLRGSNKGWDTAPDDDLRAYFWPQLVIASIWQIMAETVLVERRHEQMTEKRKSYWHRKRVPSRVSVVTLRKQYTKWLDEPTPGSGVTYGHRWKVRAHPHKYRVGPGRTQVITKYIEAYEKGPADAPLIERPRVTKLAR